MSIHLKHIIRIIKSLVLPDKLVVIGSLVVIAGLFFPWFSINLSDLFNEEPLSTIAFTGVTYIIGYLCYFFAITALNTIDKQLTIVIAGLTFILFLLNYVLNKTEEGITLFTTLLFLVLNIAFLFTIDNFKPIKKIEKHILNLFTGLENLILIFTASMIYHKQSLNFTSANLSFGIYTSLIGSALIFYGGYLQMQTKQKASVKEIFGQPAKDMHESINLKPDLNIDKSEVNQNNEQEKKENSQLSFGDYE